MLTIPHEKKRVVVAMSGGVDSSLVAALMVEQGYQVIGVTLKLWMPEQTDLQHKDESGTCCSYQDVMDAKKVCSILGIPHYVFNLKDQFKETVVNYFIRSYLSHLTPNPCVECNRTIKFDILFKYAMSFDAKFLATGHYAKILKKEGCYYLGMPKDRLKDQTYFLYVLRNSILSRLMFPLGSLNKSQVREYATNFSLPVNHKPESQDVCFLSGTSYPDFITDYQSDSQNEEHFGDIVDLQCNVLGRHKGLSLYSLGQRHGLGIATGKKMYVIRKQVQENTLVVGELDSQQCFVCSLHTVNWCVENIPKLPLDVQVRYRHRQSLLDATIFLNIQQEVCVRFFLPQFILPSGQSVVFYQDECILGGGIIHEVSYKS